MDGRILVVRHSELPNQITQISMSKPTTGTAVKKRLVELKFINRFTTLSHDPLTPNGPMPKSAVQTAATTPSGLPGLPKKVKPTTPLTISEIKPEEKLEVTESVIKTARMVRNSFFTFLYPELVSQPTLLTVSNSAFKVLELDISESTTTFFEQVFSGSVMINCECKPWCSVYSGHQFGFYAGQLGDGRCTSLFEIMNSKNEVYEIQLKGLV